MIPLNAAEAGTLLRQREIEFTRSLRQVQYFGQMETLERRRLARISEEMAELRRRAVTEDVSLVGLASPLPAAQGGR